MWGSYSDGRNDPTQWQRCDRCREWADGRCPHKDGLPVAPWDSKKCFKPKAVDK